MLGKNVARTPTDYWDRIPTTSCLKMKVGRRRGEGDTQSYGVLSSQVAVILPSFTRLIPSFFPLCVHLLPSLLKCLYLNSHVLYFNRQIISPIPRREVREQRWDIWLPTGFKPHNRKILQISVGK